jgi:ankyrin repeat protein
VPLCACDAQRGACRDITCFPTTCLVLKLSWTALMVAASNGHTAMADYLLGQGAEVHARDQASDLVQIVPATGRGHEPLRLRARRRTAGLQ